MASDLKALDHTLNNVFSNLCGISRLPRNWIMLEELYEAVLMFWGVFFSPRILNKSPSTPVSPENAATLFNYEPPEMLRGP